MHNKPDRGELRRRRQARIRRRLSGAGSKPRLSVFRSIKQIYAQLIDDQSGVTVISASTLDPEVRERVAGMKRTEASGVVGEVLARRALAKGIEAAVFDRGGYLYHGRVRALAEAARAAGLKF